MLKLDQNVDCVFRITTDDEFLPRYESIVKGYKVLLVKEVSKTGNHHYHCYVKAVKKATLDTRLKKFFKGNKQYSCKVVKDEEHQLRYLCKGEDGVLPIIVLNQLEVNIEEEHKRFWSDRRNYVESVKERKSTKKSMIDLIEERLLESKGEVSSQQLYSIRNIFNVIMEVCKIEGKLVPDDFMTIKYIETIKLRGDQDMENKLIRIIDKMAVKNNF